MSLNRYYQDELAYLRELGAEFTKYNPDLAPYLSSESRDPDVERLIEAFAFLTGRLRERLDEGLPEVIHGLLSLLWPQALRPIPCTTTVQIDPLKGTITGTETVERGTEILSKPVDGVTCSFQTTSTIRVQPYSVTSAAIEEIGGRGLLRITIAPSADVTLDKVDLSSIRFFLNFPADPLAARELRLLLRRHVRSIRILALGGKTFTLPHTEVEGLGFASEDAVLHATDTSFDGFRVLQEFLTVPEKFLFLEVKDLPPAAEFAGGTFTLLFEFDRPFQNITRITADHVRLNCTSVINLFETEGEPISLSQRLTEYRLQTTDPSNISIVDIVQVTGWLRGRAERVNYAKFESFHRRRETDRTYFYTRLRPSLRRHLYEHYLSFVNHREQPVPAGAELALARIICCNGSLPELLGVGDISRNGPTLPAWANARNIAPVTGFVPPQLDGLQLWAIISIMARNYYPVSHVEGVRSLLDQLNIRAMLDRREMRREELLVQSLQAVDTKPLDALIKGHPVRGRQITMAIDEDDAEGIGRAFLFGEVMNHFLDLFSSVNACHRFSLHCTRSNTHYTWPVRSGTVAPL